MISRYTYGSCIETGAVPEKPEIEAGALPFFVVDEEQMTLTYRMAEHDRVIRTGGKICAESTSVDGSMKANVRMTRIIWKKSVLFMLPITFL